MSWRDNLRPASFRGAPFKVDTTAKTGGRRGQSYEFPKGSAPKDEDLGRRVRRWVVTGWVIGENYQADANRLEAALNTEGPGQLITPLAGDEQVRCEVYNRVDRRQEGGMATFDLTFVEAGNAQMRISEATQARALASAVAAGAAVTSSLDRVLTSGAALPAPKPVPTPEQVST